MSTIEKNFMYVCSYDTKGKWSVRKVNKVNSETSAEHFIEKDKCDCKGFEHKQKCKHVEMIRGKFVKAKGMEKVGDKKEEVIKFLETYVAGHFDGSRNQVNFREEMGDVGERFDIICEADEKKVLWTPVMTPVETDKGKGLSVLIRMIFTDEFEKNLTNF